MAKKPLYVFDFDETLAFDKANAYIIDKVGNKRIIPTNLYHSYKLAEGEVVDLSEFDNINDAELNEPIARLLRRHLKNAIVLTARTSATPIRKFLNSVEIFVPKIVAIGAKNPTTNTSDINAARKAKYIAYAIKKFGYDFVEFWDDIQKNILAVQQLTNRFKDVTIVTHFVEHNHKQHS